MVKYFRNFPKVDGGSSLWTDKSPASVLLDNEFFDADAAPTETVYVGSIGEASRYLGLRTEAQLYLGTKNLWP
jgi:hypothetical protein